jgi:large subunit ribosomal protein L17
MRHGVDGYKLGRLTQHRWALFRSLLTALFRHERIMTTEAKAKAVRGLADHVITLAKRENLHARRQVLSLIPDTGVVHRVFDTIAARYSDRHGGYTRIIHAGVRKGDAAPLVYLELVDRVVTSEDGKGKKGGKKDKPKVESEGKAKGKGDAKAEGKGRKKKAATASA